MAERIITFGLQSPEGNFNFLWYLVYIIYNKYIQTIK